MSEDCQKCGTAMHELDDDQLCPACGTNDDGEATMTNNPTIDGVSRDLISQAYFELDAGTPSIATLAGLRALLDAPANELREHCKQCAEVVKTWPEWKQNCLGGVPTKCDGNHGGPRCADPECWNDSPALERQEPCCVVEHGPFDDVGTPQWVRVTTTGDFDLENIPDGTLLWVAPPNLEALQSTIAQLHARIAELESGAGEPICYQARHSENEPWFFTEKPGYWEWRPLYTAPSALISAQDPDIIHDAAFRNGVMHGYALGTEGGEEDYQKCINRLTADLNAARRERRLDATAALNGVRK